MLKYFEKKKMSLKTFILQELKSREEDIEVLEGNHNFDQKLNPRPLTNFHVTILGNQAKLMAKCSKYKEQMEALQDTIKEHQTVQAELHEKLTAEAKTNSDLTAALNKRDEKLKKKEKMFDEHLAAKELMEKEMDSLKKEISSLQTLNKRMETAMSKKEKQYNEVSEKLNTFKQIQAQIFSLSKTVNGDDSTD